MCEKQKYSIIKIHWYTLDALWIKPRESINIVSCLPPKGSFTQEMRGRARTRASFHWISLGQGPARLLYEQALSLCMTWNCEGTYNPGTIQQTVYNCRNTWTLNACFDTTDISDVLHYISCCVYDIFLRLNPKTIHLIVLLASSVTDETARKSICK